MPLFFLLSGFFTVMVWRRQGMSSLLGQRVKRIAVPLAIGVVTIVPLIDWVVEHAVELPDDPGTALFVAIAEGDSEATIASFHHLWFLCLFVVGFVVVARIVEILERSFADRIRLDRVAWTAMWLLVPFTFLPQLRMGARAQAAEVPETPTPQHDR